MPLTKVTAGIIAANAVNESFGSQSITGDKLGLTAINANNIVGGAVTGDKIGATSINANNIVNATITGAKLVANTVSGDVIGQNAISSNNIVSVNASVITVGTLPKARLPSNSVLQVVSNTKTDTFSSSSYNTWVDITGLSVSITPTSSSSKILVFADVSYGGTSASTGLVLRCVRNSTAIGSGDAAGNRTVGFMGTEEIDTSGIYQIASAGFNFLDSPATTSSTTYKIQINLNDNYGAAVINQTGYDGDTVAFARGSSSITVMEIAA